MFTDPDASGAGWHTSSYSDKENCVEVAETSRVVLVRDTKDREGGTLRLPRRAWAGFLVSAKAGDFDR